MGELIDVLGPPVRVEVLDGRDDAQMEFPAPFGEQTPVGNLVGESMLEGAFQLWGLTRLGKEASRLQGSSPISELVFRLVG